jgi:hypothetical protein
MYLIFDYLSERNLDAKGRSFYPLPMKAILLLANILWKLFLYMFAVGAIGLGMTLIFTKAVPRMTNKASRFVVLFVLSVPFGAVYLYFKVWLAGYSKMSWTESLIWALPGSLFVAILFTVLEPLSQNSNTR